MLYSESEERGRRLATLVEMTQRLTRGLGHSEVLNSVVEVSSLLFEGEAGFRIPDGEYMKLVAATPPARESMNERVLLGESISGVVAQTGEPVIISNMEDDPRVHSSRRNAKRNARTKSLMCLPVILGEQFLGSLHIQREKGFKFDEGPVHIGMTLPIRPPLPSRTHGFTRKHSAAGIFSKASLATPSIRLSSSIRKGESPFGTRERRRFTVIRRRRSLTAM